jgi:hypothetical protein
MALAQDTMKKQLMAYQAFVMSALLARGLRNLAGAPCVLQLQL